LEPGFFDQQRISSRREHRDRELAVIIGPEATNHGAALILDCQGDVRDTEPGRDDAAAEGALGKTLGMGGGWKEQADEEDSRKA
jgi:hypothetical protein